MACYALGLTLEHRAHNQRHQVPRYYHRKYNVDSCQQTLAAHSPAINPEENCQQLYYDQATDRVRPKSQKEAHEGVRFLDSIDQKGNRAQKIEDLEIGELHQRLIQLGDLLVSGYVRRRLRHSPYNANSKRLKRKRY